MYLSTVSLILALSATGALAGLHNDALCVTGRTRSPVGGTPFSPSYTWAKDYEIHKEATECACRLYKARNTGNKQWDRCPDCFYSPALALMRNHNVDPLPFREPRFIMFVNCLGLVVVQPSLVYQSGHVPGHEIGLRHYCPDHLRTLSLRDVSEDEDA
ncbi:hypothetical protein CDEST_11628 [Colletotrichum destructivum]|uniref:Uncharacterized protein n=1 Tax=Colletotrichum destructivum TaxID=34406 RepID=A0AAX4ITS5_9PEZI|nr:hypothetical protein CDEST_11628 [Colletotrichum destructivum]